MRTERFRRILEILGGIDPKRFASEKQHIEKRERRFVGFIKPSTGALLRFRTDQGRKPGEEQYAKTNKTAGTADRRAAASALITQRLQGAEKHLAASLLPRLLVYFWVFPSSSSRSVIFRRLMPRVDPLCSNAEVVGGSTPATPSAISVRLKPTMKR